MWKSAAGGSTSAGNFGVLRQPRLTGTPLKMHLSQNWPATNFSTDGQNFSISAMLENVGSENFRLWKSS